MRRASLLFPEAAHESPSSARKSGAPPEASTAGIERQIGNSFSVSANYIYVHTTHLPWAVDTNLLPGAPIQSGVRGANGLPTNGLPFQNWGALVCAANPGQCFADSSRTILQNNEYESVASAVYHGGIFEMRKRFSRGLSLIANYTYSKAIDDSTDFNSDYSPFNEVDLQAERALSDFDQRHKIVLAAVVESPWQHSRVLSGFELAPIVSYNSGHPFNLLEPISMVTIISLTIARRELPATSDPAQTTRCSICAWLENSSLVSVQTCNLRQRDSTSPTGRTIPRPTMLSVRRSRRHSMCTGRQLFRRASRWATPRLCQRGKFNWVSESISELLRERTQLRNPSRRSMSGKRGSVRKWSNCGHTLMPMIKVSRSRNDCSSAWMPRSVSLNPS